MLTPASKGRGTFGSGLAGRLRRLVHGRDGVAMLEFALIVPFLVFLLLGAMEVGRYVLLNQKLSRLASNAGDLVSRAADVMLKERRLLVICIRETPLHTGHLETLTQLSRLGAIIFPPVPGFYARPEVIGDIVDQTCMRMLDQIDITIDAAPRWGP